ncbi:uncharacterized protein TNIN_161931 [Trichonephila inaurata madagascariensis]|uniref:Peptidase aspartic putative domain-containing protein n=1 Tax=Trichonephila inaurata madagascariensis TaxID=2747483 RepID=A0A8X7C425_9ARAC|nr:uncharacterized protein TNIN_161931 [Trichonephila inaurata madagascariensis]
MRVKTPDLEEKWDVTLSNHCAAEEVLLQTLHVNIKAGGKTRRVRALIDSGSQRSYLLKKTAHEMNLKPTEMKNIIHSVCNGSTLQKQDHRVYEIILQNVNRGFSFDIQVLDQPIICGKIPRINKGIWEKELKEKNITLTDHGRGCPDIELLIGDYFCGHLFSGNIWTLECVLVAYETKLG